MGNGKFESLRNINLGEKRISKKKKKISQSRTLSLVKVSFVGNVYGTKPWPVLDVWVRVQSIHADALRAARTNDTHFLITLP